MSDPQDEASQRYEASFRLFRELRNAPPAEQIRRLDELEAEDPEVAREVRGLLELRREDTEEWRADGVLGDPDAVWLPERIGQYKIQGRLGEGGMGVVYEALQESPRRRVAVKLLHPLQVTPDRLSRLRREASLLGRLHHPGIAQILESSTYDLGRGPQPFFAMELVEGVDLRTYCAREAIDLRGRADLLARVAEAVDHAHQQGVVHRDLKPENILVDPYGQPKVLDFGIARATGDSTRITQATHEGQILGTLSYMSPEQLRGEVDRVDALSDVYGLGVVCYELLAGQLPFAVEGLGPAVALRYLQEEDPPALGAVERRCRGDLECIVACAMRKEPQARYGSAAALAADLRRWLRHEPIQARPPSRVYRTKKLVQKNRGLFTAVGAVLASLFLGLGWALFEQSRTDSALDRVLRLSDTKLVTEYASEAEELWPAHPHRSKDLENWLIKARELVARLPEHEAHLASLTREERTGTAHAWQVQVLSELIELLRSFAAEETGVLANVEQRLAFADSIEEASRTGAGARADWEAARRSIGDREECPLYLGLELEPQLGLRPLGRNEQSGLWEFWHVQTGARPRENPVWPESSPSRWILGPEAGLVLVLLPGGRFPMGSPPDDDLAAPSERPRHEVHLDPFFLSKYEMTQAQWERFLGNQPSYYAAGAGHSRGIITAIHPVEKVSWFEADRALKNLALSLPTEAQWEYACRAGSSSRWHSGNEPGALQGLANIADEGSKSSFSADWNYEPDFADGHDVHAPVGTYRPNRFGLHDMHGNVWEWCLDPYADYEHPARTGDGLRQAMDRSLRVYRGGSFYFAATRARSAERNRHSPETRYDVLGVRPARGLVR